MDVLDPVCHAPFTSLYLDPRGRVLACCKNPDFVLGTVGEERLLDIWRGPRAAELRAAVAAEDLTKGCHFCAWQLEDGNRDGALLTAFDHLAVDGPEPPWPKRLELALSTTCNLQCVMCSGEWSSMIRSRREHRPPLPEVYDDQFFEDLRPFLHHLEEITFLGGEPFLAAETLRVLDLIVDEGLRIPCTVTTNGTQWNDRVERILDRLPVSVAVSIDGVTAETVESIRLGASHDQILANLARYQAYARANGTRVDLTFCLMKQNIHELGAYLQFADEQGARVFINTVLEPGFNPLEPADEFAAVLAALEQEDLHRREELGLNRDVWIRELERLQAWRARREAPVEVQRTSSPESLYFQPSTVPPRFLDQIDDVTIDEDAAVARAASGLQAPAIGWLRCDAQDRAVEVGGPTKTFMTVPEELCLGKAFDEVAEQIVRHLGGFTRVLREEVRDNALERDVVFSGAGVEPTYVQVHAYPTREDGTFTGSFTVAAWTDSPPAWSDAIA